MCGTTHGLQLYEARQEQAGFPWQALVAQSHAANDRPHGPDHVLLFRPEILGRQRVFDVAASGLVRGRLRKLSFEAPLVHKLFDCLFDLQKLMAHLECAPEAFLPSFH